MDDDDDLREPVAPAIGDAPPALSTDEDFRSAYGESLAETLDLASWLPGEDLGALYGHLEAQVQEAVDQEEPLRQAIRTQVFPRLTGRAGAPPDAGVYQATVADIEHAHRALLFNGAVEACDGTAVSHDTLAITITQIGVCLVSYQGDSGSWVHRLYRRDLRGRVEDPVEAALALIEQRQRQRGGEDQPDKADRLSELARRGIMAYAERAVLLDRATGPWRMGHGSPAPYELLTGSGSMPLLAAALEILQRLIGGHRKFVFVPSAAGERGLLTIGQALRPLEYAIVDTMADRMGAIVGGGHYDKQYRGDALAFVADCGPQVVLGLYRVSAVGPPRLFYAHRDHAHQAALIAMADSALHEHRAFPTLIDLADTVCRTTFGVGDFKGTVGLAYAEAGAPSRFQAERETRR